MLSSVVRVAILLAAWMLVAYFSHAAVPDDVLSPQEWQTLDASVDRGLAGLAVLQQRNGSFPTLMSGQPGVSALCAMAFLSHGHLPGEGPYGEQLAKTVEFTVSCQRASGLLALAGPRGATLSRNVRHDIGDSSVYSHAISALMLCEVYAMGGGQQTTELQPVIESALRVTLEMQKWPNERVVDRGGWRYLHDYNHHDSDLSLTGWQLMFLRSAKNAGFEVPEESIDEAVGYIRRCFVKRHGTFNYVADTEDRRSRGLAGAGVLALAHAGFHNSREAQAAGEWILRNDFDQYNQVNRFGQGNYFKDRYHYGVFNCSQAMYQLGGRYWREFFPRTMRTLVANQRADGTWPKENHYQDGKFGNAYTSALVLMALGAPNQLLPVMQR